MGQIIFILVTVAAFGLFARKGLQIRRNILLGRDEDISGNVPQRLQNMALIAFGQQKMFKRWIPAVLHGFIYVAFLVTQIELLEIFIDGFTGNHRLIWHAVESNVVGATIYTSIISFIEILSVLAFVATLIFLIRRNLLVIPRFHKPEMNGWPKLDGNIILYLEICLIVFIFMMNSGDLALQAQGHEAYHKTHGFAISQFIAPLWEGWSTSSLVTMERIGWWGHILTVFAFLNYLPYSKHLHIMLAFPNVYYSRLEPKGEMQHLSKVTEEVAPMFEEEEPAVEVAPLATESNPTETVDDIFGDSGSSEQSEESLDDIFGDTGSSEKSEESLDDIFGDTGSSEKSAESLDDIFGDTGSSEEPAESLDDIFGDTGSSEEPAESLDDIFGDTGSSEEPAESLDDIFGDTGSSEEPAESLDDIFGDTGSSEESTESIDDIFGDSGSSEEPSESIDDIFGNNEESVDDIFGNNEDAEESIDDLFGQDDKPKAKPAVAIQEPEEEEIPKFGASDVFDLSWKNILDAYSCTECGRCTSMCPANLTGKKLSPRKVMMDVRDRADEIGKHIDANNLEVLKSSQKGKTTKLTKENFDDGKDLFDYITTEELRACTTCNACVEACPVTINPLDIITQLRRNLILDKAEAPDEWNVMFTNIENNGAPWQFSASDRDKWVEDALK